MPKYVQLPNGDIGQFPDSMSNEDIEKVLAKQFSPQKGFVERLTEIQPHQPVHSASDVGREVVRGLGNIGGAVLGVGLHPIQTAEGMLESTGGMLTAPVEMMMGKPFRETVPGELYESFRKHPLETLESAVGQSAALGPLGEAVESAPRVGEILSKARDTAIKGISGSGKAVIPSLIEKTREANRLAAEEHLNKAQNAVGKYLEQRKGAMEKAREQSEAYRAKKEKLSEENQKAVRAQNARARLDEMRKKAYRDMQAEVESARQRAYKLGHEKYAPLNAALGAMEADPEAMMNALEQAAESLRGSANEPKLLKDMENRIKTGGGWTYEDLQGDYSRLGKELSKGTLPGDVYHAYDQLHEAVGEEMQRIAQQADEAAVAAGERNPHFAARLNDARNYWRRMKQAFGKPFDPSDSATHTLEKTAPDLARAEEYANRLRLLGNPEWGGEGIVKAQRVLDVLNRADKNLPKPEPVRKVVQPYPPKPEGVTLEGKPITPSQTPRALAKEVPERPVEQKIGTEEIRKAREQALKDFQEKVKKRGVWIALGAAGYKLASDLMKMHLGTALTWDIPEAVLSLASVQFISHLLDDPVLVERLTRPTEKDIEQIPPEMRGGIEAIAKVAAKKGIRVDPRLYLATGTAGAAGKILQQPQNQP
jgi:hypothetical protein